METSVNNKCRAFTSLEQSKRLAKILPLESADMKWFVPADNESEFIEEVSLINNKSEYNLFDKVTDWNDTPYVPCWSLTALLDVIPQEIFDGEYIINITEGCDDKWVLTYDHCEDMYHSYYGLSSGADNLVDACYEMILKLHELKML